MKESTRNLFLLLLLQGALLWSGLCKIATATIIQPSVTATPLTIYIGNDQQLSIPIAFSINVPSQSDEDRLPFELAIVLDVSGSMAGEPLYRAKEAIRKLIENMANGDVIHLIKYSNSAEVVWKSGVLKDKDRMLSTLDRIEPGGGTNLYAGVLKGYEVLTNEMKDKPTMSDRRIFLFSDGLANVGIVDPGKITSQIDLMFQSSHVITSAFGVGTEFSRSLMTNIAELGRGDFFYISSASEMEKVLDVARRDIQSVIGYDAKLYLNTDHLDNSIPIEHFKVSLDRISRGSDVTPNIIAVKDLRSGDTKRYTVEVKIDVHLPKSDYKDGMKVQILKWDLIYIEKASDSNKIIQGAVEVYITEQMEKESEYVDKNVLLQSHLENLRRQHSDVLEHLKNDDVDAAEEAKKNLEKNTQILKTFIEDNDEAIDKETKNVADVQVGRYGRGVFSSGFNDKNKAIYDNMAIQLLNEDGSTAHNEL